GNNHNGLTPPWDDKLVYSFHKYWTTNDPGSIQWIINLRNTHNVPIWCGESGENSNHWYTDAVRLMEENGIGWAWWTWKKFGSFSGIASVQPPAGYEVLKDYWQNGGTKPTAEYATDVLMELADRLKLEHCIINYPVADALLRQPTEGIAIPFVRHTLPAIVFATDFDLGQNGVAYNDEVYQNAHITTGNYTSWNTGWGYRNDGVDIEAINDGDPNNGFNVGWTAPGEWMQYTVDVPETAGYSFSVRYASTRSTTLRVKVNNQDVIAPFSMPSTGGWQTWQTYTLPDMILHAGENAIRIHIESGGCNLNYYEFSNPVPVSETPFKALTAETLGLGDSIAVVVNLNPGEASVLSASDFSLLVNNLPVGITDVTLLPGSRTVIITPENRIYYNNNVKISYSGTSLVDEWDRSLEQFSDLMVINNTPVRYALPGTLQVENYFHQSGLSFEETEDTGGGSNFGFTDSGDYADYFVRINEAGTYEFSYRVAALAGNGKFRIQLYDDDENMSEHGTFNVPATGGWQTWQTVDSEITLPEGYYKLRVYIVSKEFNMNWFKVGSLITHNPDQGFNDLNVYPNPATDKVTISGSALSTGADIQIFNTAGQKVHSGAIESSNYTTVNVQGWPAGIYVIRFLAMGESRSVRLMIHNYSMN
ncbi:MAG: carbohydrate-binding protein, partial [Bacteroidota bacterium]